MGEKRVKRMQLGAKYRIGMGLRPVARQMRDEQVKPLRPKVSIAESHARQAKSLFHMRLHAKGTMRPRSTASHIARIRSALRRRA